MTTPRGATFITGLLFATAALANGCAKRAPTLIAEHKDDYARIDTLIAEATTEVAKVPERGTRRFPRCKAGPYAMDSLDGSKDNVDIVGAKLLSVGGGAVQAVLRLRKDAEGKSGFSARRVGPSDDATFVRLKQVQQLIFIREHKDASESHVSADIFVVGGTPAKIVCAFGFEGGEGGGGSAGRVDGKEQWVNKRTGAVVRERDHVVGASSGVSGLNVANEHLRPWLASNLGIALLSDTRDAAANARAGQRPKGLGAYPVTPVSDTLEARSATRTHSTWRSGAFGTVNLWETDGLHLELYDLDKATNAAIGTQQAIAVVGAPDARALAEQLLKTPCSDEKVLGTRLKALGYIPTLPKESPNFRRGSREYAVVAKKGSTNVTVTVLDFADALRKQDQSSLRLEGRRILLGQGTSEIVGSAEEVLTDVLGGR